MKIVIIDYGAGNTANVKNAFEKLGAAVTISSSEAVWKNADALVLPGVGVFGAAMKRLNGKCDAIVKLISDGKPFLGICLGMQLLLEKSEESDGVQGLGVLVGEVKKFRGKLPVPQIGWNKVEFQKSSLPQGLKNFYGYFANSYYCEPKDNSWVAATTDYGVKFPSVFRQKNIFATQFHPEKSGELGLKFLKNFIREVKQ
ncbi:MAG: imidazole glycerol phosphate synthase subunit HisH [Candidatus Micrarchaeota archaeon]|nr:imidazole glycerol phosphate synthase subunit HisH [Candidatus Micrarchaeota archaeon]